MTTLAPRWYACLVVLSPQATGGSASSTTDIELIRSAAGGGRDALAALYDRHSSLLLALACRMLKSPREAEDLLHDVFLEIWRHAGDYDEKRGSVRSWMLLRLRSRALDRLKSPAYARVTSLENVTLREDQLVTNDTAALDPDRALVRRALSALPPEQRVVLELAYFEGLSLSEVGVKLGVPLGTIKSRLARALEKLRDELGVGAEGAR